MVHVCHIYFQKHPGKVITQFQFSTLFSEAWGKAVSPCNIIAGFRTCGVFPFSPEAIKIPAAEEDTNKGKGGTGSSSGQASPQLNTARNEPPPVNPSNLVSTTSHLTSCNFSDSANVTTASLSRAEGTSHVTVTEGDKRFTHEQLEWFQRAYDEGCDVYINLTYVQWLELYHPESLPADRYSLIPAAEESHQMLNTFIPFANRANAPHSQHLMEQSSTQPLLMAPMLRRLKRHHMTSQILQCQSILYFLRLPLLPLRPCHVHASLQVQSVCCNWRIKNGKSDWQ